MIIKKPKPKKCGNKECSNKFIPTRPFQKGCCIDCSVIIGMESIKKSKAKQAASDRKAKQEEKRADKEKLAKFKKLSEWMADAQRVFNKFIRLRDMKAGYPCISSGRTLDWVTKNKVDAGHYRSVGSAPHLRFNEDNVHAQSKHDNRFLGGCAVDYRIRLIRRIGLSRVEAIESDQDSRHYRIDDLIEIIEKYKQKIKEMQ